MQILLRKEGLLQELFFYDAVVANAILDRILHHSHVITIAGNSYRLKDCVALAE